MKGDMEEQQKLEAKLQTTVKAAIEAKSKALLRLEAESKALLEAEAAEEQARLGSEAAKAETKSIAEAETKTATEAKELIREDIQNLEEQQNLEAEVLEVGVADERSETPQEKPAAHGDDVAGPCRPI